MRIPPALSNSLKAALAVLFVGGLVPTSAPAAPAEAPLIKPDSGTWKTGNGFDLDAKTRQSLSGIACPTNTRQRACLVVFDEGIEARHVTLGAGALLPITERVTLLETGRELDAEAAATDGTYFYVTGSHSATRNRCESNPDSRHVIRFRVDPDSGRALRLSNGKLAGYLDTGRLWQVMASLPALADHVGERKCLGTLPPPKELGMRGQRGVNIEGLAVQRGRLYFGFRGPARNGTALILAVDADALFGNADAKPVVTTLAVGDLRGIRDLIAVKNGFLILAGPDDDDTSKNAGWTIAFWNGESAEERVVQPKVLARLDLRGVPLRACAEKPKAELKPEALTVLADSAQSYKLLVLSDGMCDGGPLAFTIPR